MTCHSPTQTNLYSGLIKERTCLSLRRRIFCKYSLFIKVQFGSVQAYSSTFCHFLPHSAAPGCVRPNSSAFLQVRLRSASFVHIRMRSPMFYIVLLLFATVFRVLLHSTQFCLFWLQPRATAFALAPQKIIGNW